MRVSLGFKGFGKGREKGGVLLLIFRERERERERESE